ncbi:hypothetical protein V8F06_002072 [Rhypophila decipiens]
MLTIRSPLIRLVSFFVLLLLGTTVQGAPQQRNGGNNRNTGNRGGGNTNRNGNEAQQGARLSQATDGSTILDATANLNGVPLRFKISAPASQFTANANVPGGNQDPGSQGQLGINVLLHGDGGQSFFDFPNQAVQGNLMGVVLLAPSENLLWGQRTGPPSGLSRVDGAADAQLVNDFIQTVLPQVVAFDQSNVFFTGVSGGSLLLSGFFMPAHLANFPNTGVLLMCGALEPQVDVVNASGFITNSKIHFQSTKGELESLQGAIPASIIAYELLAVDAGLGANQIGQLQTVDNTPNGGHCEFDGAGFVSGIQLISDNFANIMQQGGDGVVQGIETATVLNSVVGNENLQFVNA